MNSFWRINIVFLMFLAHLLVIFTAREDFYILVGAFGACFFLHILVVNEHTLKNVFYMAVFLRFIYLFTTPNLSDDYYRFLWDGEVTLEGTNVYQETPTELLSSEDFISKLNVTLYDGMNSKDYFTVYPPVNQLFFVMSGVFTDSIHGRLFTLKLIFFLVEFLGLLVLFRLVSNKRFAMDKFGFWALNPLVIIEGIGNLHFEVIMLTFVLLAVVYYNKNWLLSAVFCGLAISTKLLPLMFLPLLIPFFGWGKGLKYGSVAVLTFLVSFLPFFSLDLVQNIWSSLDLYFQNFEFNASIFYIVKWIGELTVGWDVVQIAGPIMAGVTILVIATLSFLPKKNFKLELASSMLIVSTVYLLMSTTVHPWYVIIPFGISLFSKHKFPFWWTALVFLSYSFYMNGTIQEKPLFVILEYGMLAGFIVYEFRKKKKENSEELTIAN